MQVFRDPLTAIVIPVRDGKVSVFKIIIAFRVYQQVYGLFHNCSRRTQNILTHGFKKEQNQLIERAVWRPVPTVGLHNTTEISEGWFTVRTLGRDLQCKNAIQCLTVTHFSISFSYTYSPIPLLSPSLPQLCFLFTRFKTRKGSSEAKRA